MNYSSPYEKPHWIAAQTLWVIYFTITVYFFLALLIYLYRHRKEPQVTRRRGLFMYGFVTTAFILALVEMAINEWGILKMADGPDICETWRLTHHMAYFTSLVPGYIFLWIRQHAFYRDAMLKTMTNRKLATFSWTVLALLFIGYSFFMVYFGSPTYADTHEYEVVDMACYSGKHKEMSAIFYATAISLLVFYQSSLLFLFTYPIWKSSVEDGERSETMAIIMGYIKKCRLLTIITAGTDIIAFASSLFFKRVWNAPLTVLTVIYDVDLLINLFCLLLCLKPWKDIVLPFRTELQEIVVGCSIKLGLELNREKPIFRERKRSSVSMTYVARNRVYTGSKEPTDDRAGPL
ncbi:hypothetical protein ACHWQZ_G005601 [Mnemiopsis leidyi]